ncbi:unnamed protein product [Hyaloperonospora brassicae]|uniref:RxLR effector protein n=1 Tax=Hyaloperonospora brassicae TaxID=162125 RepID=A0AAV0T767_HYABA|nr:unnamed protein product [Hyaloperonospora brassicae]
MRLAYTAVTALVTVFVCIDAVPKAVIKSDDFSVDRSSNDRVNEVNTERRLGEADLHDGGPPLASDKEARNGPIGVIDDVLKGGTVSKILNSNVFGQSVKNAGDSAKVAAAALKVKQADDAATVAAGVLKVKAADDKVLTGLKSIQTQGSKKRTLSSTVRDFFARLFGSKKNPETAKATRSDDVKKEVALTRSNGFRKPARADDAVLAKADNAAKAKADALMKAPFGKKVVKSFGALMDRLRRKNTSKEGIALASQGFFHRMQTQLASLLKKMRPAAKSAST